METLSPAILEQDYEGYGMAPKQSRFAEGLKQMHRVDMDERRRFYDDRPLTDADRYVLVHKALCDTSLVVLNAFNKLIDPEFVEVRGNLMKNLMASNILDSIVKSKAWTLPA